MLRGSGVARTISPHTSLVAMLPAVSSQTGARRFMSDGAGGMPPVDPNIDPNTAVSVDSEALQTAMDGVAGAADALPELGWAVSHIAMRYIEQVC